MEHVFLSCVFWYQIISSQTNGSGSALGSVRKKLGSTTEKNKYTPSPRFDTESFGMLSNYSP